MKFISRHHETLETRQQKIQIHVETQIIQNIKEWIDKTQSGGEELCCFYLDSLLIARKYKKSVNESQDYMREVFPDILKRLSKLWQWEENKL